MKRYTTPEQTAKLIGLGFEKPRYATMFWRDNKEVTEINYTIGELIEILPKTINNFYDLSILSSHKGWWVLYGMLEGGNMWSIDHEVYGDDLVDALYEMTVKLKEEELI